LYRRVWGQKSPEPVGRFYTTRGIYLISDRYLSEKVTGITMHETQVPRGTGKSGVGTGTTGTGGYLNGTSRIGEYRKKWSGGVYK
jgi:hypothetical protein